MENKFRYRAKGKRARRSLRLPDLEHAKTAVLNGLLSADLAAGIRRVRGMKNLGVRLGNWLTAEQGHSLWQVPDDRSLKGKRDRAMLCMLLAAGSGGMNWWR